MTTGPVVLIAVLLMSVSMSALPAKANADVCSALLSGESPELTAAIHELSRLRYDLDLAVSQGEKNMATWALQDAYIKKETEILRFSKINPEELIARIRTEIESIQKEAKNKEAHRTEVKEDEQKVIQKEIQKLKKAERLLKTGTFKKIPAGKFMMGDGAFHEVTLTQDYEIQTTLVTQRQYFLVKGENPSKFQKKEHCPDTWDDEIGCPENPVETVSWDDAQAFIQKLNAEDDGYFYRLPTEAEWEYAARAGTTTPYYWGDSDAKIDEYAWTEQNSGGHTHEVGKKKPNAHGLYDLSGNVWEWVIDWYGDYPAEAVTDPQGPSTGFYHSLRGGCWSFNARNARSGNRDRGTGQQNSWFGFRLVRTTRHP